MRRPATVADWPWTPCWQAFAGCLQQPCRVSEALSVLMRAKSLERLFWTQYLQPLGTQRSWGLAGLDPEWLQGGMKIYISLLFQEEGLCSLILWPFHEALPGSRTKQAAASLWSWLFCAVPTLNLMTCSFSVDWQLIPSSHWRPLNIKAPGIHWARNLNTVTFRTFRWTLPSYSVHTDSLYLGILWNTSRAF